MEAGIGRVMITLVLILLLAAQTPAQGEALAPPGEAPVAYIGDPLPLGSREYSYMLMQRADPDHDGVSEKLDQASGEVRAIIWFSSDTAVRRSPSALASGLREAMALVEASGGRVYAGPWLYSLPGFAAILPGESLQRIASLLMGLDVDGDGLGDRVLISVDGTVEAYNYWGARQMAVRPQVWDGLGYTGRGVTIGVLDSGIDGGNEAFQGKIVYWADYSGDVNGVKHSEPYDDNSHGTHVAGSAAGVLNALDPQGRLTFVFGLSEFYIPDAYAGLWLALRLPIYAYPVNSTGTIEVEVKWKSDPDGRLTGIALGYCGWVLYPACNPEIVATLDTFTPNQWYRLTYGVSSASQFGFYVLMIRGQGSFAFLPVIHLPVASPGDGFPLMAGTAPGAKIAGGKVLDFSGSGADSWIISAIDDMVASRTSVNPPIYIISMSLGGSYSEAIDQAVTNAVSAGVLVVAAAGNNGPDSNYAGTGSPSSNPYALTVAALDGFNNVTEYSSKGGESMSDPTVIKPDIAAPGGGVYMQVFSADTSWHDDMNNYYTTLTGQAVEDVDWSDAVNSANRGYDDAVPMQGTSMATPHVSGVAALVIEALLDSGVKWSWNSPETALLVKNILLMSTYETYPVSRVGAPAESPSLDRGGKDPHEGYGALDASAAVRIAHTLAPGRSLQPGAVVEERFRHGVLYDSDMATRWRWPFGPSAWGSVFTLPYSTIKLSNGTSLPTSYTIALRPAPGQPAGMDLDLYVYSLQGDRYGEPVILAKSTGPGASESLTLVPRSPGQAVVVVKRATEASPGGQWILSIGPGVQVQGQNPDGAWVPGQAWDGFPVEVTILSPEAAPSARLEVYDNTTGETIYRDIVALSQAKGGTSATVPVNLPSGIAGHQLLFIVEIVDQAGRRIGGLHAATVNVNPAAPGEAPQQPAPEGWVEVKPYITPPVDLAVRAGGLQPGVEAGVYLVHPGGALELLATLPVGPTGEAQGIAGLPRSLAPGSYTIAVYQGGAKVAETQVTVAPASVTVDRQTASPGEVLRVTATGLGTGYSHVYHVRIAGITLATISPDRAGAATVEVVVPPLPSGVYTVEIVYPGAPVDRDRTFYAGPLTVATATIQVVDGVATERSLEELRSLLEARITTLELAVAGLNESITSLEDRIDGLRVEVQSLAAGLEALQANVTSLQEAAASLEDRLTRVEELAEATSAALGQLDERVQAIEAEAVRLNQTLSILAIGLDEAAAKISSLEEKLRNTSMTLAALQRSVKTLTANIAQLREDLDNVVTRDIPGLEARLTLLQSTLQGVEERLTQQEDRIEEVQQALASARERISALEEKSNTLENTLRDLEARLASTRTLTLAALGLAVVALALAGAGMAKRR